VFFEHCRKILSEIELAQSSMSNRKGTPRGRLRVSLPSTLGKRFVVPRLPELLKRHPELTLDLQFNDRWVNLVEDAIDVALRVGALNDSSLVARRIGQHQIISIASPSYVRGKALATLADLSLHACLTFRLPTSGRERAWHFLQAGEPVALRPRARLTLDDGEGLVEAVRAGLGVAQVPSYMAAPGIADGSLVEVLVAQRPRPDPLHAVHPGPRNAPPAVRAFVEFLARIPELEGRPAARASR
jgi:DNA-binding transcriptional LysR family regulator